jgi:hypothetical protein
MIRLPDFRSIRGELYCVYRPCVAEQLAWEDGRSAALILSRIADMDEARTFEARIEALERALDERDGVQPLRRGNGHARRIGPRA